MKRCSFVNENDDLYINYHDKEWGNPNKTEEEVIELFILELFQAGLSWRTLLHKRESFRLAFDNFNLDKIINYDENKINELLNNKDIIRNKRKIEASIKNAKIIKEIINEYNSFTNYFYSFTNNKIIYETGLTRSCLSDTISKDLIKRGMSFAGSVTIYSFLQAMGLINSHEDTCFLYKGNTSK